MSELFAKHFKNTSLLFAEKLKAVKDILAEPVFRRHKDGEYATDCFTDDVYYLLVDGIEKLFNEIKTDLKR